MELQYWVGRSLFDQPKRLCSTSDGFHKQKRFLNELLSWNAFPKFVRVALMRKFDKPTYVKDTIVYDNTVYIKVPYLSKEGELLLSNCIKKLKRSLKENTNLKVSYNTKKLSMFVSTKDKTPDNLKSHCIYEFRCPACSKCYIGKTDRNFESRLVEHGTPRKGQNTAMYSHLLE